MYLSGKESTYQPGEAGLIFVLGRSRRREQLPIPGFLLGESDEQRTLPGYSPWGQKESDTTEQLSMATSQIMPIVTSSYQKLKEARNSLSCSLQRACGPCKNP